MSNRHFTVDPRLLPSGNPLPERALEGWRTWRRLSPRIVSVRSNTEETSGGRLVLRQNDALMVPNPRACSQRQLALGGEALQETALGAWRVGKMFPPVKFMYDPILGRPPVRPLQRQEDAVMVPNPRACSRGGSAPRDNGENISPRIVFCTIEYWGDPR